MGLADWLRNTDPPGLLFEYTTFGSRERLQEHLFPGTRLPRS